LGEHIREVEGKVNGDTEIDETVAPLEFGLTSSQGVIVWGSTSGRKDERRQKEWDER
jgi:hypothetical protein